MQVLHSDWCPHRPSHIPAYARCKHGHQVLNHEHACRITSFKNGRLAYSFIGRGIHVSSYEVNNDSSDVLFHSKDGRQISPSTAFSISFITASLASLVVSFLPCQTPRNWCTTWTLCRLSADCWSIYLPQHLAVYFGRSLSSSQPITTHYSLTGL